MNSLPNSKHYLILCLKCKSKHILEAADYYFKFIPTQAYDNSNCDCLEKFLQEAAFYPPDYLSLTKDSLFKILDTEMAKVLYS